MKKYVKLTLCGLAAVMLVAGCSKKDDTKEPDTTEAESTTGEAPADLGQVTKLGQYKGVEVTKDPVVVTDEDVETQIKSILTANPEYIAITDRPAQMGDTVDIDYVGMKDGVAFDGGTAQGQKLELGSNSFIDGFEEGLVGAAVGAELSLNLTFPDPYDKNPDLAGQPVVFDVTVNGIEEKKDAVLDDNFVQRISDFNTVDEFRADTRADLEDSREKQAEQKLEYDAMMAVMNSSEFQVNDEAVEEQYKNQYNYYTNMAQQVYGMTIAEYASVFGMTEEQLQEELRTASEQAIKQDLLTKAIAEAENLKVDDSDREAAANKYSFNLLDMEKNGNEEVIDSYALMYKITKFVRDNAVVTEGTVPETTEATGETTVEAGENSAADEESSAAAE